MSTDSEHSFMFLLAICISSLEKYLVRHYALFLPCFIAAELLEVFVVTEYNVLSDAWLQVFYPFFWLLLH